MKKICLLFISVLGLCTTYAQQKGMQFQDDLSWKQILALAAKENKPIFLDCYTTWCGPCKAMAREVFSRSDVGDYMNAHFISVKKDMEKGEGIDLYKKYEKYIPGFPTYLVFNAKGELIHQVTGYQEPPVFISMMQNGLDNEGWMALNAEYAAGQRDWPFILKYFTALNKSYQIMKLFKECETILPQLTTKLITDDSTAYAVFRQFWRDPETPLFRDFISNPGIYMKHHEEEAMVDSWTGELYREAVAKYVNIALKAPEKYDTARARALMHDLRVYYTNRGEKSLALLLVNEAFVTKNYHGFDRLLEAASHFSLLKDEEEYIVRWAEKLATYTTDKALLQICLKWSQKSIDDGKVTPGLLKRHLVILEKMGDASQIAVFKKKLTELEKEFERRAAAFHKD